MDGAALVEEGCPTNRYPANRHKDLVPCTLCLLSCNYMQMYDMYYVELAILVSSLKQLIPAKVVSLRSTGIRNHQGERAELRPSFLFVVVQNDVHSFVPFVLLDNSVGLTKKSIAWCTSLTLKADNPTHDHGKFFTRTLLCSFSSGISSIVLTDDHFAA